MHEAAGEVFSVPEPEKERSLFQFEPKELIQAAVATLVMAAVRVALAVLHIKPRVPEFLGDSVTAEQLITVIAGLLWLLILLVIFTWRRWLNRRIHVHGVSNPGDVSIYVAELEGDSKDGQHRSNIISSLRQQKQNSVQILRAGIELRIEESGDAAEDAAAANRRAQKYLAEHRGDLLIWGRVLAGPAPVIELRFTSAFDNGTREQRYNYDSTLRLSGNFGNEVALALWALAAQQTLPAFESGKYVAEVLIPVAVKLRRFAANLPPLISPDNRAFLLYGYGNTELSIGEQSGDAAALARALDAFDSAAIVWTREAFPQDWARVQKARAHALAFLSEFETGTGRLQEAINALRAAQQVYTRQRYPYDWAGTQNGLGNIFRTLGERENGTKLLEEAVQAFQLALEEWTHDRFPRDWATVQSNLSGALRSLGACEKSANRLSESVEACRAALTVRTRDRVPLDWAAAQANLGTALTSLGDLERSPAYLEEAVEAYHDALQEYTRERSPLLWATIQNNLAGALRLLGTCGGGAGRFDESLNAYRSALEEWRRDRVPLDWATTTSNIGEVYEEVGRLEDAAAAYRQALEVLTPENHPRCYADTRSYLARVLEKLASGSLPAAEPAVRETES
jgi:tetratricopeptide (TPR) repeat protein